MNQDNLSDPNEEIEHLKQILDREIKTRDYWRTCYLEALLELNKANKGLRRLSARLKRNKPLKHALKKAFEAGAAHTIGSHKEFTQTHPNFEEWHKAQYKNQW